MALVSCPECGKEISDAARSCPHCGHPIQEPQPQDSPPVPRKSKRPIIIAACALVLVAVVGVFVGVQQKQSSDRAAYIASLNELRTQTIRGGSIAEKMCNLTKQVWYNTIYEERDSTTDKYTRSGGVFHDDFNTSLSLLYAEDNTATVISGLQASREVVDGIMADLQNPPAEFAACYEAADSLYDAYCGLLDLAISPSGSLKSYSENFAEYDDALLRYYNKLEALIPSE